MELKLPELMDLLVWCKENGVQSVRCGEFSANFGNHAADLSGEELKEMLDKNGNLSPEQYEEILYHSARP